MELLELRGSLIQYVFQGRTDAVELSAFTSKVRSAAAHGFRVPPEFMDDNVIGLIVR
jgi:hypothetical protein